jgi:hypothetical protein
MCCLTFCRNLIVYLQQLNSSLYQRSLLSVDMAAWELHILLRTPTDGCTLSFSCLLRQSVNKNRHLSESKNEIRETDQISYFRAGNWRRRMTVQTNVHYSTEPIFEILRSQSAPRSSKKEHKEGPDECEVIEKSITCFYWITNNLSQPVLFSLLTDDVEIKRELISICLFQLKGKLIHSHWLSREKNNE